MENLKLEKMLDEIKKAPEKGFPKEFSELMEHTVFLVPAILPPNTAPEVIQQIIRNSGKDKFLPEGVNPRPCLLENGEGTKFLPLFTAMEQLDKGGENAPKFPMTLNIPFQDCINMLKQNPGVQGAVINPYTHNLVVPVNIQKKEVKKEVTIDEYHVMMRQAFESNILPKHLFTEKGTCAERLNKEHGTYVKELFEEAYLGEIACPFMEDEFDFLSMQITDDLLVIQITMPAKYNNRNTASTIFCAWDSKKDKAWYYALVRPVNANPVLVEKFEDGSLNQIGEVQEESGLLTSVIEMIQKEE